MEGAAKGHRARGRYLRRTWEADSAIYAPPRYRRACAYDAFVPDPILGLEVSLPGAVAGVVSEAEQAVADLNANAGPELMPLARLLLRTESIASSKVEGMQIDARSLARAEANQETGRSVGREAAEILANIDAMQLSIERASSGDVLSPKDLQDIHRVLLERAPNSHTAGQLREVQNWIGGNDYNPCGADFVPPPPDDIDRLVGDLTAFVDDETLPRSCRQRSLTRSSRPSTLSRTATAGPGAHSCRLSFDDAAWRLRSSRRSASCWRPTSVATWKG